MSSTELDKECMFCASTNTTDLGETPAYQGSGLHTYECKDCGQKMVSSALVLRAYMRVLGSAERPLKLIQDHDPYMIDVPGFGCLLVGRMHSNEMIERIGLGQWHSLLIQPDEQGKFSAASNQVERTVVEVEGHLEIAMLHKTDRLDVVLEGMT